MTRATPGVVAALILGLLTGAGDAAFMYFVLGGTWKIPFLHPLFWLVIPLIWMTLSIGVALLFSLPYLRRFLVPALIVSGPGLLFLSRGAAILRDHGIERTGAVVGLWCAVMALLVFVAMRFFKVSPVPRSRWTAVIVAVWVVAAAGVFAMASDRTVENRVGAGSQPAHGAAKSRTLHPNIVLVFIDTVRFDDTDLDGDGVATPSIDRFATQSSEFDNAWAPAPWTLPSHSAVFTGVNPWRTKLGVPTLAEHLSRAGYDTAAVFANPLLNPSVDFTSAAFSG